MNETTELTKEQKAAAAIEAKIKGAFTKLSGAGKTEDEVKMGMISAGAGFKNVTRLYNLYAVDSGMVMGKEDKAKLVADSMKGADVTTEEGFNGVIDKIVAAGSSKGVTDKSAASLVRRAAKAAGIECWKRPKGEGKGATGFANTFYTWLRGNPACTEEQSKAIIMGTDGHEDTSENTKRHLSHYQNIARLVNDIKAA